MTDRARTGRRLKAAQAADPGHHDAVDQGFEQPTEQVADRHRGQDLIHITDERKPQRPHDHRASDQAEQIREHGQERGHSHRRQDSRHDEKPDRFEPHRGQGVDLFPDLHGPKLGCEGRAGAAGQNNGGDQGSHLPKHRDSDEVRHEDLRSEPAHRNRRLKCQDESEQKPDQRNDGEGIDAGPFCNQPGIRPPDKTGMANGAEQCDRQLPDECQQGLDVLPDSECGLPELFNDRERLATTSWGRLY